jgi:hypothetical protein
MERNLDDLSDIFNISKDDIKRSQNKYINNSNSHKLLGRDEVLNAKVPRWLNPSEAIKIKHVRIWVTVIFHGPPEKKRHGQ